MIVGWFGQLVNLRDVFICTAKGIFRVNNVAQLHFQFPFSGQSPVIYFIQQTDHIGYYIKSRNEHIGHYLYRHIQVGYIEWRVFSVPYSLYQI